MYYNSENYCRNLHLDSPILFCFIKKYSGNELSQCDIPLCKPSNGFVITDEFNYCEFPFKDSKQELHNSCVLTEQDKAIIFHNMNYILWLISRQRSMFEIFNALRTYLSIWNFRNAHRTYLPIETLINYFVHSFHFNISVERFWNLQYKFSLSVGNYTYQDCLNKFHLHIFTIFAPFFISHLYGHVIFFGYTVIENKSHFCLLSKNVSLINGLLIRLTFLISKTFPVLTKVFSRFVWLIPEWSYNFFHLNSLI